MNPKCRSKKRSQPASRYLYFTSPAAARRLTILFSSAGRHLRAPHSLPLLCREPEVRGPDFIKPPFLFLDIMVQSMKSAGFGLVAIMILPAFTLGGNVLEKRENATTSVVCGSQYSWMNNKDGQSPCLVAAILSGACDTGGE